MVRVALGSKSRNVDFDVSNIELKSFSDKGVSYSISLDGVKISENKSDYVMLEGKFNFWPLASGNYEKGIKHLDAITVVENGKVVYTAAGLDMTGKDAASGADFKSFLAGESYSIKGNGYGNEITGATRGDVISGLSGNDKLNGMAGDDRLSGGLGDDRLNGGDGGDLLSGGAGADKFVFVKGDGRDAVSDFDATGRDHDIIDLSHHTKATSFRHLDMVKSGSSVHIDLGDDVIVLKDVSINKLDGTDFDF